TIEGVELHHAGEEGVVESMECDAVLLQLGFSTKLGPLKDWGFELEKGAIVVDGVMKTSLDRVWACGDITTFDGKLKLIATGFAEAAIAVAQAVHHIRPEMKLQPAYSTNTGVPGADQVERDERDQAHPGPAHERVDEDVRDRQVVGHDDGQRAPALAHPLAAIDQPVRSLTVADEHGSAAAAPAPARPPEQRVEHH